MSILCSMVGASFTVAAVAQVLRSKKGITAIGNAQISTAQSQFGGASALFDTSSDWLAISNAQDMRFGTGNFTMEFWFRPISRASDYPTVFQNREYGTGAIQFTDRHNYNPSKLQVWVINYAGGDPMFQSTTTIANNTWYHIALTRSGNSWRFFVNGIQEGSTVTYSGDATSGITENWAIGNDLANPSVTQWNGYVDEVRVSNTARYTTTFTPSTTAFVNDANTLFLMHANGTNASTFFEDDNGVRAPISLIAGNNAKISTAQSQFGGSSIEFDGADDFVTVTGLPSTTTGDCTYEFWGRFDILPWNQTYAGGSWMQIAYDGGGDYLIISRSGGSGSQVNLQIATGNRYGAFTKSGVNLAINTWYHIAYVRSSGVWKAFFNGTELTSFTNESNFTNSGRTENVRYGQIGKFSDGRGSWDGYMDEIRFSNSARYTGDFTPSTAPFVNDANTLLLIHGDGTNNSTVFRDDNGARAPRGIQAIGNAQIDTAQSKFGGASALFDGAEDYLILGSNPLPSSGDFTVEMWVRLSVIDAFRPVWSSRNTGGTNRGVLYINQGGITWWNAGDNINSSQTLTANTWAHIACVINGNAGRLFVNGIMNTATFGFDRTGEVFQIGKADYSGSVFSNEFPGHIDEIRISNIARYTEAFNPSTVLTAPFQSDASTLLLIHADGTDGSTVFTDDNGIAPYTP